MPTSVKDMSAFAHPVSRKLEEQDLAQSDLQRELPCTELVSLNMDRTSCIDGAAKALEDEDYKSAEKCLGSFRELSAQCHATIALTKQGNDWLAGAEAAAAESKSQTFNSKQRLEGAIRSKLAAAVEARDEAAVVRLVKLFPFLGLQDDGLRLYVDFLRNEVVLHTRDELEVVEDFIARGIGNSENFGFVLGHLFREVGLSIEENEELLRSFSGGDALIYAVQELQQECDSLGPMIMKMYAEDRDLLKLTNEIVAFSKKQSDMESTQKPDPQVVETILDEMLDILYVGEKHMVRFMTKIEMANSTGAELNRVEMTSCTGTGWAQLNRVRMAFIEAQLNRMEVASSTEATDVFRFGPLRRAMQELSESYVVLETFYLKEKVRIAIETEEVEVYGKMTSMVGPVFHVLRTSMERAISSCDVRAMLHVLHQICGILSNEYKDALFDRLLEPNLNKKVVKAGAREFKTGAEDAALPAPDYVDQSASDATWFIYDIGRQCVHVFLTHSRAQNLSLSSSFAELEEMSKTIRQMGEPEKFLLAELRKRSNLI